MAITDLISIGKDVVGLIGGKKKYSVGDCGEPVPSAVSEMLQNLPKSQLTRLSNAYSAANKGNTMPLNGGEVAFAAYGGYDCKVTSSSGKAFKRVFDELMAKYGPGGSARSTVPADTIPTGYDPGAGSGTPSTTSGGTSGFSQIPGWTWAAGGSLLVLLLYLLTQGRPTA